jgi:magnesium transporter
MMLNINTDSILEQIQAALEKNDINSALKVLEDLRTPDQADVFYELEDEEKIALLPHLDPSVSADILEELEDEEVAELVSALDSESAVRILDEMDPDEAADFLNDVSNEQAETYLSQMENPEDVRPLLLHADDSAGGLMTSEFIALRTRMKASDAINVLRTYKPDSEEIYYLFVVTADDVLAGVIGLRDLITASPDVRLEEIMDTQVVAVTAGTDQEECARIIQKYDLLALPVVDVSRKLIGVITVDDVMDVLEEETTEDFQRLGGAQPLDQSYLHTGTWAIAKKRFGWLLLLFLTGSLTGTVMRMFEAELAAVVALTYFIPLLIGTGGNAGSQTTSTIIRALAIGDIDLSDALYSLWHEFRIGLILGIGMAVFAYFRAITWGTSPELAFTVAFSIIAIVVWANASGAVLPLLAAKLKIDPTVVSGPVMSTLVDATVLFLYFSIAKLVIGL